MSEGGSAGEFARQKGMRSWATTTRTISPRVANVGGVPAGVLDSVVNGRILPSACSARERVRGKGLIGRNEERFGIPQGSPMSAVLSNIYMLDFDGAVAGRISANGGLYRRYCDDMLCVVPQEAASGIQAFVHERIADARLEIQAEKTNPHHFAGLPGRLSVDEPLQYLGFLFDGRRILLRTASVARYYRKMRAGVQLAVLTKRKHDRLRLMGGQAPQPLKRRKLNRLYSYIGRQNFISYALRAAQRMDERAIRRQIKPHWKKLEDEVETASAKLLDGRGQRRAKEVSVFERAMGSDQYY